MVLRREARGQINKRALTGGDASEFCVSKKVIQAQDEHGRSLLAIAVCSDNLKMVKWLIEAWTDIRVVDNNGRTLLMYAKDAFQSTGDISVFRYLLNLGLDPLQRDYMGRHLVDYCQEEGVASLI